MGKSSVVLITTLDVSPPVFIETYPVSGQSYDFLTHFAARVEDPESGIVGVTVTIDGAIYDCVLGGSPLVPVWMYPDTPRMDKTWPQNRPGTHTFKFTATNGAGLKSSVEGTYIIGAWGTTISIDVTPTSGAVPFTARVSGYLRDAVLNAGVANRTINVLVNGSVVATTITTSTGYYQINITFTEAGQYEVQTEFPGDSQYLGC